MVIFATDASESVSGPARDAAAEFIRSELGRNQPSDESAHEVYIEQAIAVLDGLLEQGQ